jgi:hypothetical protein
VEPETAPRQEYERHASGAAGDDQDVFLDVPHLYVESLDLEVADLRARVSLQAEVLNLLRLNVGVDAVLGQVRLDLRNVEAQALLKVRLDNVAEILNRVLATIDSHPEMIEQLTRASVAAVEQGGAGVGQTVREVGEGLDQLSRGVREEVRREPGEREPGEPSRVRRIQVGGPPPIETSATVEAEARQAETEARQAETDARRVATETRQDEASGRQGLPGERLRHRGLPRRAERR